MSGASTVLITGASAGIGLELARFFAADGHRLLIVGRNRGRLSAATAELVRLGAHSVSIFETGPMFAVYHATKALVLSFSETSTRSSNRRK